MRYLNWDVLVFPETHASKVPMQEFKTACQVVVDPESKDQTPQLLPTVTSFIQGLPRGAPFRVSIHSWQRPLLTPPIQSIRKVGEDVAFEARLFIDGRLMGSKWFMDNGPWPVIIDRSVDLNKHGQLVPLRFPTFHEEILSQSFWNAGDDLGRIKLVIAEGFCRPQSLIFPLERLKNVVTFSFQHAPLDYRECDPSENSDTTMFDEVSSRSVSGSSLDIAVNRKGKGNTKSADERFEEMVGALGRAGRKFNSEPRPAKKRQRIVTPVSSRVIDAEDDPARLIEMGSGKAGRRVVSGGVNAAPRRVLSGIENGGNGYGYRVGT